MSLVGKQPINVPEKVEISIDGSKLTVKGPKGSLTLKIPTPIKIEKSGVDLLVKRSDNSREAKSVHGSTRTNLSNMVKGVTEGFSKELEIRGVGFRAATKGNSIDLTLGFSHPVSFPLPEGISAKVDQNVKITLSGADKTLIGLTAAKLRALRPPEPYKGKGVRYADEHVKQKVGKTSAG